MKYLNDIKDERQTPEIPAPIRELMSAGLDMKLHIVQHAAQMAYLLAGKLLNHKRVASMRGRCDKMIKEMTARA
ncbi:MAG: hypothetical protein IH853_09720 [Bacteroidetes bacterium]|nr:hypothetical protein [Bacteroidota bacterium]